MFDFGLGPDYLVSGLVHKVRPNFGEHSVGELLEAASQMQHFDCGHCKNAAFLRLPQKAIPLTPQSLELQTRVARPVVVCDVDPRGIQRKMKVGQRKFKGEWELDRGI